MRNYKIYIKQRKRNFTKSLFSQNDDFTILAEYSEIDFEGFNKLCGTHMGIARSWLVEGSINIINDFNNMRFL